MKENLPKFLVELSDKRNIILLNKLKETFEADEFSFAAPCDYGSEIEAVIFSPARKLCVPEVEKLPPARTVVGGSQSNEIFDALGKRNITYVNLLENEAYAVKNAKLTAEAALSLVIAATDKSIYENDILILGCGRVGKATALLFGRLGVKVSIATFNKDEFAACALYADKAFFEYGFSKYIQDYDVIINTIPNLILDGGILEKIKPETIILELASVNCLDKDKIGGCQFQYIPAPGLPAKYSAAAAANLILDIIIKQWKKENGN